MLLIGNDDSNQQTLNMKDGNQGKLNVLELYKFPKNLKDIFGQIKGQYGEHLRLSEVRDVLVMYIRERALELEIPITSVGQKINNERDTVADGDTNELDHGNDSEYISRLKVDRSSVLIPPTDPLYKLAAASPYVTSSSGVSGTGNGDNGKGGGGTELGDRGNDNSGVVDKSVSVAVGKSVSNTKACSSNRSTAANDNNDMDELKRYAEDDEDEWHSTVRGKEGVQGGSTVGGVWMPAVGGKGPWGSERSRSGGGAMVS